MNIPLFVIVVSIIFLEDNEYHPQISLCDCFYEHNDPSDMRCLKHVIHQIYHRFNFNKKK